MKIYAALAAALARTGSMYGGKRRSPKQTLGHWQKSQPSEVAHLSKHERLKRRRIHRLSTRKRR